MGNTHPVNDERLQWLSDIMRKDSVSITQMAKRMKIGAATLSRLLAGKYTGNVQRMLERIEAFRRGEIEEP
jgi:hypothetical protein